MKPEEKARQEIDQWLEKAGWNVQDYRQLNLGISELLRVLPSESFPLNLALLIVCFLRTGDLSGLLKQSLRI